MNTLKRNIRDLELEDIRLFLAEAGEQKFRADQIFEWLWKKGASDFKEMSNLSAALKEKLNSGFYLDKIIISDKLTSRDKTTKVVFQSLDNKHFEGVLIPGKERVTACISTQAGCALNCSFCATGKLGFSRNLTAGEIFDQVFELNILSNEIFKMKLSNIVIMGMGEPLLNYDNTFKAVHHICSEAGLAMSPQRITLSTAGIAPQIIRMADENIKINLSLSLHSADNQKRTELMPINKKYDLEALKKAIKYYYAKTKKRITYEYLLLGNVNDSLSDAAALAEFAKISPCKINLIEYNPDENDTFQSSEQKKSSQFLAFIESKNMVVTVRKSKGQDIWAACGQLANKKQ